MREQEFRTRDKKIHKMTRDGLTEKNLTQGTEENISQRTADASFGRTEPREQATDRHAAGRRARTDMPGPERQNAGNKRRAAESAGVAKQGDDPRYRHGQESTPPEGHDDGTDAGESAEHTGESKERSGSGRSAGEGKGQDARQPEGTSRRQKKYERAQRRADTAGKKLEKAKEKLPTRRRMHLERQYDSASGKTRHRLRFESEVIPENDKGSLPKRAGKAVGRAAATGVIAKAHRKIQETEKDNVGVEATHKTELATERTARRLLRRAKRRMHDKPYRAVRRAEKRAVRAGTDVAYQKFLMENPEIQKKALSKWIQKQRIRKKYAAAAREAAKGAQHTGNVLNAAGKIVRALAQSVSVRRTALIIVALGVLLEAVSGSFLSSCTAMLTGIQSAIISTCYVAEEKDINASDLRYTELETDLQRDINSTQASFPGYDEYQFSIGEIGHNPYELLGYLSAAYDAFTYVQVEAELGRLFGLQYRLTREETMEPRSYTDEDGEEQEYEWRILHTVLEVTPLSEVIAGLLAPGDQTDRYGVYMQTCGNRQCYGSPFDFPWLGYVTSPYGYRIHPLTGEKDLHRGIDIGAAEGTPIQALQDGRVVSAGNAGDYGLCVVIEDGDGYQSRYAHCGSLLVSAGQEVKRGDVVATVGSTGSSTGPHLHLEVSHNSEYLNPYFFVDNGGEGYTLGGQAAGVPQIPDDPGQPMGDGSFEAMLTEAEKYLGYPYVWGGSSPSTSFDCSGYVSWVINNSGVGNVGRQTAQGLFNLCTPVSKDNLQPGDLVFFTGTSSSANPVTHVGIYAGGNLMIHCGNPVSYANINGSYWTAHFYCGGRLP